MCSKLIDLKSLSGALFISNYLGNYYFICSTVLTKLPFVENIYHKLNTTLAFLT